MEGTIAASVIEVIRTISVVGKGTDDDPTHEVTQYWTKSGQLIAEHGTVIQAFEERPSPIES